MRTAVRHAIAIPVILLAASAVSAQQQKVDAGFSYHRIWATLPVIGTGHQDDPLRAMFVPAPLTATQGKVQAQAKSTRSSILGMQSWISDDGKTMLVELVAADRNAFSAILNSTLPGVKVFERGKDKPEDILTEFRKYKKDFAFGSYTVRVP
jgi:hypothetical protein